uniref:Uncharacterized protein n=1 Tax=Rhinolophus ferrumequinum TaxID=59479 RepID=A0A671EQC1_RHIFE
TGHNNFSSYFLYFFLSFYISFLHLLTPNRPKITHCILLCQSHSTSNGSYSHPNTLKLHRSYSPNNHPRPYILNTVLPGKLKL